MQYVGPYPIIRALPLLEGLTQVELARTVDRWQSWLCAVQRAYNLFSDKELERLAAARGAEPDTLRGEAEA